MPPPTLFLRSCAAPYILSTTSEPHACSSHYTCAQPSSAPSPSSCPLSGKTLAWFNFIFQFWARQDSCSKCLAHHWWGTSGSDEVLEEILGFLMRIVTLRRWWKIRDEGTLVMELNLRWISTVDGGGEMMEFARWIFPHRVTIVQLLRDWLVITQCFIIWSEHGICIYIYFFSTLYKS